MVKQGPRVLVTDAEERSVLAACRGLAAAGYRVSTVSEERFAPGHWSRFSNERITFAGPQADPEGYVERLSRVLRRDEYDLVIPGTELSLLPISERRDLIEPHAHLRLPPHEAVLRALDKPLLQDQAEAVGLTPPRSVVCSSAEEALATAPGFGFPLVVKPARSIAWTDGRIRKQGARVVRDWTFFEAAVAAVGVPLTLQEYVPGPTIVSCAAVRVDGRLLGFTLARYARTYPPQVGMAALATTIAPPRTLIQQVEELLELIGWCGVFELELLELGENRFGAIDFNPRPFGWMALPVGAGANLPALWCDHVLGRRSVSRDGAAARVGVRYRWEDGDAANALVQLRRGDLRSAAAVLRPHRRVVHAHFRADDPAPLVARMFLVAQKVSRRIRDGTNARSAVSRSS
jgi:predicted ATP-grasp superfamily ATP-dependent carboligase